MTTCCYCKLEFDDPDTRPYGPDKAPTCFPCAMQPNNIEVTQEHYSAHMERVEKLAREIGGEVVFTDTGPKARDLTTGSVIDEH